jgi:pilus assembly protein CpaE
MDTWILSESALVAGQVQLALKRHGIDCPDSKLIDPAELDALSRAGDSRGRTFFCAMHRLTAEHFEFLRRLRSLTDKEVVVVAAPPDHSTLLQAMRAGATDYLNADSRLDAEVAEFVLRVQVGSSSTAAKGRLISVVPCDGPSDGSILAVNVAAVIAGRIGTCALLDFHLRGGDLSLLLKTVPRHTLSDLLRQHDRFDEAMLNQALTPHESGIRLLAGLPMFSDLRSLDVAACQRIVRLAQGSHPFTIVNCEDISHAEQIQAVAASDDVILTIRMDLVSINRARQLMQFMVRNRVPLERIHVVAMGTGNSGELPSTAVKSVLGIASLHHVPADQAAITVSINVGNPLVLESPKSAPSRAIVTLVGDLTGLRSQTPQAPAQRSSLLGRAAAVLAIHTASC